MLIGLFCGADSSMSGQYKGKELFSLPAGPLPEDALVFEPGREWLVEEDDLLLRSAAEMYYNWDLIADHVNSCSHWIKNRTWDECRKRYIALEASSSGSSSSGTAANSVAASSLSSTLPSKNDLRIRRDAGMRSKLLRQELKKRHTRHLSLFHYVKKLVAKMRPTRPSTLHKKVSLLAHPSHEAAVKKAGVNMTKLLTPAELAMRKLQRARALAEAQHGMVSKWLVL